MFVKWNSYINSVDIEEEKNGSNAYIINFEIGKYANCKIYLLSLFHNFKVATTL
jgi:hypothetical protein